MFVALCCAFCVTGGAHAVSCAFLGITPGGACSSGGGVAIWSDSECMSASGSDECVAMDCNGECVCVPSSRGCGSGPIEPCGPCLTLEGNWTPKPAKHYDRIEYSYQNPITCECISIYDYRCHAGYWWEVQNTGGPVCNRCLCFTDKDGIQRCGETVPVPVSEGLMPQTACFMPSTYTFENNDGYYRYGSTCNYSD